MSPPLVTISRDSRTTRLTLNRPEKRNALSIALLEEMCAAIAAAEADPSQRLLYLEGAGSVFCAGLDLEEAVDLELIERSSALVARALESLGKTRLVTIAIAHGAAIAGGAGLLCVSDFVAATAGTRLGFPEARRGLVAALVMAPLLRQVRERDARELLLGGELIDAQRALEIGLVNRVTADLTAARAEARAFGESVLQGGPGAVESTKHLLAEAGRGRFDAAFEAHRAARRSGEAAEGLAACREKRPPRWK